MGMIRAPYTCVPSILAGSRSAGIKTHALKPRRAACAATAFARFPVEEQLTISKPKFFACDKATATTRSLKLRVGKQTASFLMYRDLVLNLSPRLEALTKGVKPTGTVASNCSGRGSSSL